MTDDSLAVAIAQEAAAQNQIRANAKYLKEMRCKHRKPEERRTTGRAEQSGAGRR